MFTKKKQGNINNELKKLRLAKLANNNISKSDLVNIKWIQCITYETLETNSKTKKY